VMGVGTESLRAGRTATAEARRVRPPLPDAIRTAWLLLKATTTAGASSVAAPMDQIRRIDPPVSASRACPGGPIHLPDGRVRQDRTIRFTSNSISLIRFAIPVRLILL
jgi:hypothetical protein